MVEIELKTRVHDPDRVKKRLSGLGIYDGAYEKDDAYWTVHNPEGQGGKSAEAPSAPIRNTGGHSFPSLPPSGVRVRRETNTTEDGAVSNLNLVTYKIRELRDGVEINDEREFEISNGEVFEDLLGRLGLSPGIRKNKQGWAWRVRGPAGPGAEIRAELSDVKSLGWFLELEILVPEGDEKTIALCRENLFSLLEKLEIPREDIESRPYTEMLRAFRQPRRRSDAAP
jgi:adenylate cyclase class 2